MKGLWLRTILLSVPVLSLLERSEGAFVDPGAVLVEGFEGWGSSLAWFGDVLGGMPEEVQDEITQAFFSVHNMYNIMLEF
jgi:hypothetical protein